MASSPNVFEVASKSFPELLNEYEETVIARGEKFSLQGSLKPTNLLLFFSLLFWFYVFYQLVVNISFIPVWASLLAFFALFFMRGGAILALLILFLCLR